MFCAQVTMSGPNATTAHSKPATWTPSRPASSKRQSSEPFAGDGRACEENLVVFTTSILLGLLMAACLHSDGRALGTTLIAGSRLFGGDLHCLFGSDLLCLAASSFLQWFVWQRIERPFRCRHNDHPHVCLPCGIAKLPPLPG